MGSRQKIIVLVLVLAAAGILLLWPYFGPQGPEDAGFAVTANPTAAIQEALDAGMPLYIEFYSDR